MALVEGTEFVVEDAFRFWFVTGPQGGQEGRVTELEELLCGFGCILEQQLAHGVVGHVFFPEGEPCIEVFLQLVSLGDDGVATVLGFYIENFHRECIRLEDVFWRGEDVGLEIFSEGDDLVARAVDLDVFEGGQAIKPEYQETCGKTGDEQSKFRAERQVIHGM